MPGPAPRQSSPPGGANDTEAIPHRARPCSPPDASLRVAPEAQTPVRYTSHHLGCASVRSQVAQILEIPEAELAILAPDKTLEFPDEALVSDHRLRDDDVLYAVRRLGGSLEKIELLEGPEE